MSCLSDVDIKKMINKKDLVIYPFSDENITGVGYDLIIGKIVNMSNGKEIYQKDNKIVIPPKTYCLIITKEHVWLSGWYMGTLHARGTLAAKGLFTNSTNVDPNFSGQMIMSVYNVSNTSIELDEEDAFITLILHQCKSYTSSLVGKEGEKVSIRVLSRLKEMYANQDSQKNGISKLESYLALITNTKFNKIMSDAKISKSYRLVFRRMKDIIIKFKVIGVLLTIGLLVFGIFCARDYLASGARTSYELSGVVLPFIGAILTLIKVIGKTKE